MSSGPRESGRGLVKRSLGFVASGLRHFRGLGSAVTGTGSLMRSYGPGLFGVEASLNEASSFCLGVDNTIMGGIRKVLIAIIGSRRRLFRFTIGPSSTGVRGVTRVTIEQGNTGETGTASTLAGLLASECATARGLGATVEKTMTISQALKRLSVSDRLGAHCGAGGSALLSLTDRLKVNSSSSDDSADACHPAADSDSSDSRKVPS